MERAAGRAAAVRVAEARAAVRAVVRAAVRAAVREADLAAAETGAGSMGEEGTCERCCCPVGLAEAARTEAARVAVPVARPSRSGCCA